jgi:cellulose synthase/poly-beta-1,6-N-acetylglucosamine synthase-like glycosyltransferase
MLAAAELRAAEIGVGADRVLIHAGVTGERAYLTALATQFGAGFDTLEAVPRTACPLDDDWLLDAAAAGLLPLVVEGTRMVALAPQGLAARHLAARLKPGRGLARQLVLTTGEGLRAFVRRHAAPALAWRAVNALRAATPEFSAGTRSVRVRTLAGTVAAGLVLAAFLAPSAFAIAVDVVLALIFLCWTGLRVLGMLPTHLFARRAGPIADAQLPVYTIVVALYREAGTVAELIAALDRLDYPREKLDIKLVLEPDDVETRIAVARLALGPPYEVILATPAGPRTKPKALNCALPFARGTFTAVYDVEDRPEPDQLRKALQAFYAGDRRLACVQARLTIDNTDDSWITRMFTAEYAGLFDVFLPGIAAWRLPLPLGGSSNHFPTAVLRRVGAWDPYNVTEDADLGMRLARLGYRTIVIDSTTYEEAPARFLPWLRQRTRWFKGWMQTWIVHVRRPLRLWRDLGTPGLAVFQLVVGGTVLAALVHPIFVAALVWQLAAGYSLLGAGGIADTLLATLHGSTLVFGYGVSAALGLIGLAHRRLLGCTWALLLMPLYWLLLSLAAWNALLQLIRHPYRWEKTAHGLARTSRLAARKNTLSQRYTRF